MMFLAIPEPHFPRPSSPRGLGQCARRGRHSLNGNTGRRGEKRRFCNLDSTTNQLLLPSISNLPPNPLHTPTVGALFKKKKRQNNNNKKTPLMLTSQMKPGPRMGGPNQAFLLPHSARSAQQPPLPLFGGKRNWYEAGGSSSL